MGARRGEGGTRGEPHHGDASRLHHRPVPDMIPGRRQLEVQISDEAVVPGAAESTVARTRRH